MGKAVTKIQKMIFEIRGQKVMLDSDLAELYQVEVKYLNRTAKRNITRFPADFMFQLTDDEWEHLRCQIGTTKMVGKIRYNPHVFTEQGIAMLSGLLNSEIAIKVNIQIMRTFVQLRHYVMGQDTNAQIAELRKLLLLYIEKNDKRVNDIIIALNNLIAKPVETKKIGFGA
ncbi:MAG: ORF6N domain-containing protein [Treponema sp.]|nr:ORF6N domain-containing protein [Treponema sp.]